MLTVYTGLQAFSGIYQKKMPDAPLASIGTRLSQPINTASWT